MLKYIPLSKQTIVIIGPPEYFSNAKTELSKMFWTVEAQLYLNLDFGLIKKK